MTGAAPFPVGAPDLIKRLAKGDMQDAGYEVASAVVALIRVARLALENDTSGQDARHSAASVLELAEELVAVMETSAELHQCGFRA